VTERQHDEMTLKLAIGHLVGQMRANAGLSVRELANQIGYDFSYIAKIEIGELASDPVMEKIDELFHMGGSLMDLVYVARKGKVQDYGTKAAEREAKADRIQVSHSSSVPSLLQTERYALMQMRLEHPKAPDDFLMPAVNDRMARQAVFQREEPPLYWAIMDEAALRRPIGGKAVMAEQIAHILKVAECPDVTLQVVPFECGGYWTLGGSITLLRSPNNTTCAYVESYGSGEMVSSSKKVVRLEQKFDLTRRLALTEDRSLELMRKYLEEYE
jgi:transcriptional regulator with XRE-family HTH domain